MRTDRPRTAAPRFGGKAHNRTGTGVSLHNADVPGWATVRDRPVATQAMPVAELLNVPLVPRRRDWSRRAHEAKGGINCPDTFNTNRYIMFGQEGQPIYVPDGNLYADGVQRPGHSIKVV